MSKTVASASISTALPSSYELDHVHTVYNAIAPHFSSTRYKPWPVVVSFLASLPVGSVGLDAGTGNGKYLIVPTEKEGEHWTIGLDRSVRLLDIAKHAGGKERECVLGDALETCWKDGAFDYAISIATIHHLSTPERRKKSIQVKNQVRHSSDIIILTYSLLRCLSPSNGRALIYVWATEQDSLSKRLIPPEPSEEGQGKQKGRDVFVPWVLSQSSVSRKTEKSLPNSIDGPTTEANVDQPVYNRYYHMFDEGELRALVLSAAEEIGICFGPPDNERLQNGLCSRNLARRRYIDIVKDDWERSNFYVELRLYEG
ncbi:S-adenosyl-L-methionine-dependent methyltransferase [Phellopilus nigrolimitatus]|nr:S-adenosyl-L-methionine-dependent methyltransferase [Phellopilus nigrolimitatus]